MTNIGGEVDSFTIPILMNAPIMERSGGLGISAVRRAKLFEDAGHSPVLLVNVIEPQLPGEERKLRDSGKIGPKTQVRSLLHDLISIKRSPGGAFCSSEV